MVWQWDTVVPSGLAKVLLFVKAAPILAKKVTAESHFRSCKTLLSERRKLDNAFVCESRQFPRRRRDHFTCKFIRAGRHTPQRERCHDAYGEGPHMSMSSQLPQSQMLCGLDSSRQREIIIGNRLRDWTNWMRSTCENRSESGEDLGAEWRNWSGRRKPKNQETKKPKNQKKQQKPRLHTLRGGGQMQSVGSCLFVFVFFVFFGLCVDSHCRCAKQRLPGHCQWLH